MKVIIVSHPDRAHFVTQLVDHLDVMAVIVNNVSALNGHLDALSLATTTNERVVIMEDDAIPVVSFNADAEKWCAEHPFYLVSFYLGTSRPKEYQILIEQRLASAARFGDEYIMLSQLVHGVCYSIPPNRLVGLISRMRALHRRVPQADYCIGSAWAGDVVYPIKSLVQHRDSAPVERHPDREPRVEPRVARHLAGPLMFNPN